MKTSTERILTTHTGSFPRPDELLPLLTARETGAPYEQAAQEAAERTAVHTVVRQQVDAGIDVVNDGEMSRFGFATYLLDRVTGFDEEGRFPPFADLQDYPEFARRRRGDGTRILRTPSCTGPIKPKNPGVIDSTTNFIEHPELVAERIVRFASLVGRENVIAVPTAPAPGVPLGGQRLRMDVMLPGRGQRAG